MAPAYGSIFGGPAVTGSYYRAGADPAPNRSGISRCHHSRWADLNSRECVDRLCVDHRVPVAGLSPRRLRADGSESSATSTIASTEPGRPCRTGPGRPGRGGRRPRHCSLCPECRSHQDHCIASVQPVVSAGISTRRPEILSCRLGLGRRAAGGPGGSERAGEH